MVVGAPLTKPPCWTDAPNICTLAVVQEVRRGEPGYVDWCVWLIEAGLCSCDGCGGHLVDGVCVSCGCRHHVSEATRFQSRGAAWIPVYENGRCAHADQVRAEARLQYERQVRRRRLAESHGDPQR